MAILSIYERRESMKSKRAFMLFVTVLWIIAGITLIITLNPVSYTHLDVDKRQIIIILKCAYIYLKLNKWCRI